MNHYWVEKDTFLAGEYPRDNDEKTSQAKIDALVQLGVSAFIDLTHEADGMEPYTHFFEAHQSRGISYQRFPIPDFSVPESDRVTEEILDAIDEHIARGRVVYVHCWGGVGRTGLIVGCWLARHGFPGKAALFRLRELWGQNPKSRFRRSPETDAQERYITEWRDNNDG
ncbi:MAG: hypothetical protein H6Q52_2019 [Deltaproteobacteria bacterium]|nr:hypothetical protein [Deltaproteobacteria bacterium]